MEAPKSTQKAVPPQREFTIVPPPCRGLYRLYKDLTWEEDFNDKVTISWEFRKCMKDKTDIDEITNFM